MEDQKIEIPVTLGKETQIVSFTFFSGSNRGWSGWIAAARIGNGAKVHRTNLCAIRFDSMAEAKRLGWRPNMIHEIDGAVYGISTQTVIRNRQAMIVAFASKYEGTQIGSEWAGLEKI